MDNFPIFGWASLWSVVILVAVAVCLFQFTYFSNNIIKVHNEDVVFLSLS